MGLPGHMLLSLTTHYNAEFYISLEEVCMKREIIDIWFQWKAIDRFNGAYLTQDFSSLGVWLKLLKQKVSSVIIELVNEIMTFE